MLEFLRQPWPWYVVGPLVGLAPAALLLIGNRLFGVASNLRHACAVVAPSGADYFRYDWRRERWNLAFVLGIVAGGFLAGVVFRNREPVAIADSTRSALLALGVREFTGLVPADLFGWSSLFTLRGLLLLVGGGFLVGFGTAYGGGCTSGHGLSGIADLQAASLVALVAFFVGGVLGTFVLLPLVMGLYP
jgi:uncharacterized membrane protein YedE/YeeE